MLNTTNQEIVTPRQPLGPIAKPGKFWRVLQFPVIRAFLLVVVASVATVIASVLREVSLTQSPVMSLLVIVAAIVIVVLLYVVAIRLIERRPASEFGLSFALPELGLGALVGFLAISATVGLMWAFGTYRVTGIHSVMAAVAALSIGLVPAFAEEILFRGVLHRIIEGSLGTWVALIVTALFFGASHLANPNASWFAAIAIAIEAGLMLGAAYTLTQRLWLPIGIHFAWNWAQGGLYGVPVSGIAVEGLLSAEVQGPALLSGGGFGAEATVLAVGVCLLIFVGMIVAVYRRNMLILPFWQRRRLIKSQS